MGTLYLVRHGQASFGADNYDQLSDLGERQSERLGAWFAAKGIVFDACISGTLERQRQTLAGICRGAGMTTPPPQPVEWPGLNEYDSAALIATVHPGPLDKPDTPEKYRHHFRLLRQAMAAWMQGSTQPAGMPEYRDFAGAVGRALDDVRTAYDGNVLLVSSGGPIATAVGLVLGTPPQTTIELNLRIRNSAVTEFVFNPKRHMLLSYNHLPHLDDARYADWITYA